MGAGVILAHPALKARLIDLAKSERDIYSLSKMLGHTDIKTTTIYLAASVEHLRSQMDKHPLNGRTSLCLD